MRRKQQLCRLYDLTLSLPATSTPIAAVSPAIRQERIVPYLTGWKYQKALMDKIYSTKIVNAENSFPDSVLLLQHSSVYTLGKGGTLENLKFAPTNSGKEVYRVSRGGEVTWHGPGQLVIYPIIDLSRHKKDLRWYLSNLEDVIIATLLQHGINGARSPINPGVWVDRNKICAVGITCSRWITMHGLALNVDCDLSAYSQITPCGISPEIGGVCSMNQFNQSVSLDSVKTTFLEKFQQQFQFDDYVKGSQIELEQFVQENPEVSKESLTLSTL
jgi:lipoyl(octanoyl) transferase